MSAREAARVAGREAALWGALLLLAAVATWPLALHLGPGERLADRTLDDHVYWWDFWWVREALVVRGVDPFFCPDVFVPHGAELIASPFAFPLGVLSLPLQALFGPLGGAVVAVKLFGLLLLALGAWGMSLLLRALGVPALLALLGALLFAFTPFRMVQLGRIHYLAGAFVPLFLHASLRAARGGGARWYAAAALHFAAALTIDASTGLELVLATGALLGFEWCRGASLPRTAARLLACGAAGALLASPFLVRFLAEARRNPGFDVASRLTYVDDPNIVQRLLSPDLDGLAWFTAPALHQSVVMGAEQDEARGSARSSARLNADLYETFRPPAAEGATQAAAVVGLAIALLALVAISVGAVSRGGRIFALLALAGLLLALGPQRTFFGVSVEMPYGWLARLLPGMEAGRYPAAHLRLFQLGIAAAAALGAARSPRAFAAAGALAAAGYFATAPLRPFAVEQVAVEPVHRRIAEDPAAGAVLELPPRMEIVLRKMGFGQIVHGRPLLAGPLTRVPPGSRSFFEEEPFVRRCMRPVDLALLSPEQLAIEVEQNRAVLAARGVRFIVLRRYLFTSDPRAGSQLLRYLGAHGFALEPASDGHVLVRVEP